MSGGAIASVGFICGIDMSKTLRIASKRIRNEKPRVMGNVSDVLQSLVNELLPNNAHELASGSVHIGVLTSNLKYVQVSEFFSKSDLIGACLASSQIPLYMDGNLFFKWRNQRWLDGGLIDILPPESGEEIKSLPYPDVSENEIRQRSNRVSNK